MKVSQRQATLEYLGVRPREIEAAATSADTAEDQIAAAAKQWMNKLVTDPEWSRLANACRRG